MNYRRKYNAFYMATLTDDCESCLKEQLNAENNSSNNNVGVKRYPFRAIIFLEDSEG